MIVKVLKEYGEVPVDFVAEMVGANTSEMDGYLQTLQKDGVVRVDESHGRDDATVSLK
jgi:DNA-binding IclR family transcriptional regulator